MRNQTRILDCLYRRNKEIQVEEIARITRLSNKQVYHGLNSLKQRGLIIKRYEEKSRDNIGYKSPPSLKVYAQINKRVIMRIRTILGV